MYAVTYHPIWMWDIAKQRDQNYALYKKTKDQAVALSPQVLHTLHQSIYRDSTYKKISNKQQSIQAWFEYCENVFAQYQAVDLKMPKIVPADTPVVPKLVKIKALTRSKTIKPVLAPKKTALQATNKI